MRKLFAAIAVAGLAAGCYATAYPDDGYAYYDTTPGIAYGFYGPYWGGVYHHGYYGHGYYGHGGYYGRGYHGGYAHYGHPPGVYRAGPGWHGGYHHH